eukprot:TRINITY_DN4151_c3_g1_i1.p1 TRINITY_DN4151_c3_g1~~TRINITY_DN4151_c3_g1_i1.p1  ORF type:complete len:248 (+),score=42.10 TRINITY_DN4151_c3_g1_i1:28-771(+)
MLALIQSVLITGQLVTAPMPCNGLIDQCRQSVRVTNALGATVDNPLWDSSGATEGFEKGKCWTGLLDCFQGKSGNCGEYENCVPAATRCVQIATVRAYGVFASQECDNYMNCIKLETKQVCLASYGSTMIVDGNPPVNCDAQKICDKADAMGPAGGCVSFQYQMCMADSDCTWIESSRRCDDNEGKRDLMEVLTIIMAFVLLLCVLACCCAYVIRTHTKPQTSSFKHLEDDDFDLGTGHIDDNNYAM